jgi:hypothetical protein
MADKMTAKQEKVLSETYSIIQDIIENLEELGPVSREFAIVLTKLEEAEMWCQRGFEVKGYEPEVEDDEEEDDEEEEEEEEETGE